MVTGKHNLVAFEDFFLTASVGGVGRVGGIGLPRGLSGKEILPAKVGDVRFISGSGRSPGGNGNPLQYSCLENSMDTGAWWVGYSSWGHKDSVM